MKFCCYGYLYIDDDFFEYFLFFFWCIDILEYLIFFIVIIDYFDIYF